MKQFINSRIRLQNDQDGIFYIYPAKDQQDKVYDSNLYRVEDAYDDGVLVIQEYDSKFNAFHLEIQNQEYVGERDELERILFTWAQSENYVF